MPCLKHKSVSFLTIIVIIFITVGFFFPKTADATTDTYNTTTTWTVPEAVHLITVEVWGGGGAGGGTSAGLAGAGGGGGGAYSSKVMSVTPSTVYTVTVGSGGTGVSNANGNDGGSSWFSTSGTVFAVGGSGGAKAGTAGAGGSSSSGVGTTKYSGGSGASNSAASGGGGGESASSAGAGTSAIGAVGGTGTAGGDGGNGAALGNGSAGSSPGGGGGGGAANTTTTGGNGAVGQVSITYTKSTIAVNAGNSQSATVGTSLSTAPSVIVRDSASNPLEGISVTFAIASGGGSITGASTTTNASGIATVGSWTLGTTAGTNTMTATASGFTGSPVTFTATGNPGTATYLKVTGTASATAGTADETTVTARDSYGNVATSYTGTKSLTFSGPADAPDGTHPTIEGTNIGTTTSVVFTSGSSSGSNTTLLAYKAETVSLDVTDGSISSTGDASYDLDLTVSPASLSAAKTSISATPNPGTATTTGTISITVQTKDTYKNNRTSGGNTVVLTISGSNPGSPIVTDNSNGIYSASYIPLLTGTDSITGTITAPTLPTAIGSDTDGTDNGTHVETINALDTTAPVISSIVSSTTSTTATITWTTNESSDSTVNYGSSSSYGSASTTSSLATSHSITLTGLSAATTYHFQVSSADASSNIATSSDLTFTTSAAPDTTAPVISSIVSSTTSTTATITWTTNEEASSKLLYSIDSSFSASTTESDTSPRVTSHVLIISSLASCTSYNYKIISTDSLSNTETSSSDSFTTIGCPNGLIPITSTSTLVTTLSGGTIEFTDTSHTNANTINLSIPSGFTGTSSSVVFQIQSLTTDEVMDEFGYDSSKRPVGDSSFNLSAYADTGSRLETFDEPLTVTFSYADSDVDGIIEPAVWLYHYHNGSWDALSDCEVNTISNTITCSTQSFSIFSVFGSPLAVASSNSQSRVVGSHIHYGCKDPNALNYEYFAASDSSLCKYATEVSVDSSSTMTLTLGKFVFKRDLKKGMTGKDVSELQKLLIYKNTGIAAKNLAKNGTSVYFGNLTKAALIEFQKSKLIKPSIGFFGPITRGLINK